MALPPPLISSYNLAPVQTLPSSTLHIIAAYTRLHTASTISYLCSTSLSLMHAARPSILLKHALEEHDSYSWLLISARTFNHVVQMAQSSPCLTLSCNFMALQKFPDDADLSVLSLTYMNILL